MVASQKLEPEEVTPPKEDLGGSSEAKEQSSPTVSPSPVTSVPHGPKPIA